MNPIKNYLGWLQEGVPAGPVERYPEQDAGGGLSLPGVSVAGDLSGVPLLGLAALSGTQRVRELVADAQFQEVRKRSAPDLLDVIIVGAGPAGVAAAIECRQQGLRYRLLESTVRLNTIENFPKGKPVAIAPAVATSGTLQLSSGTKESVLAELKEQIERSGIEIDEGQGVREIRREGTFLRVDTSDQGWRALRVILAIGKSGNARRLGVPGEDLPNVFDRLFDPAEFAGQQVLVVGGGDSAMEASVALAMAGARVVHSYRKSAFARPKEDNLLAFQAAVARAEITPRLGSTVLEIESNTTLLDTPEGEREIKSDAVFTLIGRELPTAFFARSGIRLEGERSPGYWIYVTVMLSFFTMLYFGKKGFAYDLLLPGAGLLPTLKTYLLAPYLLAQQSSAAAGSSFGALLAAPFRAALAHGASGWETWLGPLCFGIGWLGSLVFLVSGTLALGRMIQARQRYFGSGWPRLKYGYLTLAAVAYLWVYMTSTLSSTATWVNGPTQFYSLLYCITMALFGLRRALVKKTRYIRYQMATVVFIQIFFLYLLPFQTIGDTYFFDWLISDRFAPDSVLYAQIFPDGRWTSFWFILFWPLSISAFGATTFWTFFPLVQLAFLFWLIRHYGKGVYCGWICSCGGMAETLGDEYRHLAPHGSRAKAWENLGQGVLLLALVATALHFLAKQSWFIPPDSVLASTIWGGYLLSIDIVFAGVLGLGVYFFLSGRFWCRYGCPLAAIMHIMTRFSRYRILAEKKDCISCNVCTRVCHMGIDVMNFANKGIPMNDVECVRCSTCVHSCPMGVLAFGKLDGSDSRNRDRKAVPDYGKDDWRAAIR